MTWLTWPRALVLALGIALLLASISGPWTIMRAALICVSCGALAAALPHDREGWRQ